jgi:hypothetical protein
MTPGTGTSTTPVFNAYAQTLRGGSTFKADNATLLQVFCASSTNTVLKTSVEYSEDTLDWYRNYFLDSKQFSAGTTSVYAVTTPFSFSTQFASSTLNGASSTPNQNCSFYAFNIPTPTQFMRVVESMTGGNGSVWDQLVPIKELQ